MNLGLTHCYIGPFGVTLALVFAVYVIARLLWIVSKFHNADRVQGYLESFSVCRRTDLPEGDLKRIPKWLQNSGIEASVHFEFSGTKYRTRFVTYWDFIGMKNYSHRLSEILHALYSSGKPVNVLVSRDNPKISVIEPTLSGSAGFEIGIVFLGGALLTWFAVECLGSLSTTEVVASSLIGGLTALIGSASCLNRARKRMNAEAGFV